MRKADVDKDELSVTAPPDPNDGEKTKAASERLEEARADLTRLHQDVLEAEERVVKATAAPLLEANEQLVGSALRAQADAEACAKELKGSVRPTELDALTELPNRAMLLDRFADSVANAKRKAGRLAVLFLDLDNF